MITFPTCELHAVKIVSEFPPGCPTAMLGDEAQVRLTEMRDRSFWPGEGDPGPFIAMRRAYEVCSGCQSELRADLHVRMLREAMNDA